MQLSQQAIDEFKAIYKKEYNEDISDDEAREKGTRLLRIFQVMQEVHTRTRRKAMQQADHKTPSPEF